MSSVIPAASLVVPAISQWVPSTFPSTTTSFTSIAHTNIPGLESSLTAAASSLHTATATEEMLSLSQIIRGAEASLAVISAQEVLQTATATAVEAHESQVIYNNTLNLNDLWWEENVYEYRLVKSANIIFLVVFSGILLYNVIMAVIARYEWYNITFICGYLCEMVGYIAKVMSFNDTSNSDLYLAQFVTLTIAPAFIMGGIYFLFAQVLVIHGRQYGLLRPLWYSYIFISWDVFSLVVQAIGGGIASGSNDSDTSDIGVDILIAGVAIQISGMTVFVVLLVISLNRLYFMNRKMITTSNPLNKWSGLNFVKLLLNTPAANEFKQSQLDMFYNQYSGFKSIRQRSKLLPYFPLVISMSVVLIYIRCVFRVVELSEGWHGYLMNHEIFTFVLDSAMVALSGLLYTVFHPFWVFGRSRKNVISSKDIRKNVDEVKQLESKDSDVDESTSGSFLLMRSDRP